jgi:hypothetical protein
VRIITSSPGRPPEVAGDQPDADQDRHHVPVDVLEGVLVAHDAEPDHHRHADQRGERAVDDVGHHRQDGHGEDAQSKPLHHFHGFSLWKSKVLLASQRSPARPEKSRSPR